MVEDARRDLNGQRIREVGQRSAIKHDRIFRHDRSNSVGWPSRFHFLFGQGIILPCEHSEECGIHDAFAVQHSVLLCFALCCAAWHRKAARSLSRNHRV